MSLRPFVNPTGIRWDGAVGTRSAAAGMRGFAAGSRCMEVNDASLSNEMRVTREVESAAMQFRKRF